MKEIEEEGRKDVFVSCIQKMVDEQHRSNNILNDQCNALQKRNEMLENELKISNKNTRRSMIFNIITTSIAFASLVVTILLKFIL